MVFLSVILILCFAGCTDNTYEIKALQEEIASLTTKVSVLTTENQQLMEELADTKKISERGLLAQQPTSEASIEQKAKDTSDQQVVTDTPSELVATETPVSEIATTAQTPAATPKKIQSVSPSNTPTPIPKQKETAVTVYITKTGSKYHKAGCRYLSKSSIPIDLASAKSNYSPCSVCRPPN